MKIKFVNNKFVVDPIMTFDELKQLLEFQAIIAEWDMRDYYKDCTYCIIDGALYGITGDTKSQWYYYDPSVRKWSKCDNPSSL